MVISFEECCKTIDRGRKVSSAMAPADHSILYIAKKIEKAVRQLYLVEDCVVILQEGIEVPEDLADRHTFIIAENPQEVFDTLVRRVYGDVIEKEDSPDGYVTGENGVTAGQNVVIVKDTRIEPGVFLGHRVVIGDRCKIRRGAIIKHAFIGNDCVICENVIIGNTPFKFYKKGNTDCRMTAVGKVVLGNDVEVGGNTVVDRGTVSDTVIGRNTKIDVNCHVAHDVRIGENVVVTGSSSIGSFSCVGEGTHIYSARIMKRIDIGRNSTGWL